MEKASSRMTSSNHSMWGLGFEPSREIDRLQFLSGLGLAQRVAERSWQLSGDHERKLRERQVSRD